MLAPTVPNEAPYCCPLPPEKNFSGPDEPAIQCYIPDGCCGPSPCDFTEWDLVCQVRQLLPEGDPYNTTLVPAIEVSAVYTSITVGCSKVGCEQLIFGGCCEERNIPCQIDPVAPQLAVVDCFATGAYTMLQALCAMLRELNPCTAEQLVRRWADRMGIKHPDPCGPGFSEPMLKFLICFMLQLRYYGGPINWEFLTKVAARFGVDMTMHYAGDMNCGPIGWWSMARDEGTCPPVFACPPDPTIMNNPVIKPAACFGVWPSLNIVYCPAEVQIPENCNIPTQAQTLPHDPELYEAFTKWLLPKLLEGLRGVFWCVYECNPEDCITL